MEILTILQFAYRLFIQQQTNGVDCGLFVLANLAQFCYSNYIGKDLLMFNEKYLRDNLVYCLKKDLFTPFPPIETKAKLNKKKVNYVDINNDCTKCWLPKLMQEMVGCKAGKKRNVMFGVIYKIFTIYHK